MAKRNQRDFSEQAAAPSPGLIREYLDFLRSNKKWWLIPILAVLLPVGFVIVVGGTAAAPLIYALF